MNDSVSVRTTALDSVRGRLTLTGPLATAIAWLSMPDGQSLRVIGLPNNILRQLAGGLELVLFGARTSGGMRGEPMIVVDDYAVRAVGGEPAYDGILRREPTGDVLELRDGRRLAIRRLPEVLADANGKHVWVGGPLQAPTMAGIIDPDRQFRMQRLPR